MTTVIGIKASLPEEGIVLLSDRQVTLKPVFPGFPERKAEVRKIFVEPNGRFAVAGSGQGLPGRISEAHEIYEKFLLCELNEDWREFALLLGSDFCNFYYDEIFNNQHPDMPYLINTISGLQGALEMDKDRGLEGKLLFASRLAGKLGLFELKPHAKTDSVEETVRLERSWHVLGSGYDHAEYSLELSLDRYNQPLKINEMGDWQDWRLNCSMEIALNAGIEALKSANQDIYTSGLDFIVVQREEIYDFGKAIDEKLKEVREHELRKVLQIYRHYPLLEDHLERYKHDERENQNA